MASRAASRGSLMACASTAERPRPPAAAAGEPANSENRDADAVRCNGLLGGDITRPARLASYLVTKLHHAALVGPNFGQVEGNVSVKPVEERDSVANQDRQD